jgi:hypothetical protein
MTTPARSTMKAFRDRTGATPSEELRTLRKRQASETGVILRALKLGPLTIPEIVAATELPSPTVVWYVMTFCRDKTLRVAEKTADGFYRYALVPRGGR